jgi:hypothetical protein
MERANKQLIISGLRRKFRTREKNTRSIKGNKYIGGRKIHAKKHLSSTFLPQVQNRLLFLISGCIKKKENTSNTAIIRDVKKLG